MWSSAALNLNPTSQAIVETIHVNFYPVLNGHTELDPIAIARTALTVISARFCDREGGLCAHVKVRAVRVPTACTTPGPQVPY